MLRRLIIAVLVSAIQIAVLWLMIYVAVVIIQKINPGQHQGISWGILVYYLFVYTSILIAVLNLSAALVNRKWFMWVLLTLVAFSLLFLFGANPVLHPYRTLLIVAIIVVLAGGKGFLDALITRMIDSRTRKNESESFSDSADTFR